jgi:hypothetical protein
LWGLKEEEFLGLSAYIQETAERISLSQQFDDEMWPYIGDKHFTGPLSHQRDNGDYTLPFLDPDPNKQTAIKRMKKSFEDRVSWMHDEIESLTTTDNW